MSSYNDTKNISDQRESLKKYEMEPLENNTFHEKSNNVNFVSIQMGERRQVEFIPLAVYGSNNEKGKMGEGTLKEGQEKVALLEQEAYEQGFAQGEKDGLELGEKKALKVVEDIEQLFIEMSNLREEILKRYENEILKLIFAIAEKIVHHQIRSNEGAVEGPIFNALKLAIEKSKVNISVNPDDYDYVEKLRPELFTKFKELKSVVITSDPSISRGGCFLETPYGDVDACIETQLKKIYQCLQESCVEKEDA